MLYLRQIPHAQVEAHHLSGLLYSKEKVQKYRSEWKQQLVKNQWLKQELALIGETLTAEGCRVSLLKGFALLGDIYADWGARFASDVDMLVSEEDRHRLKQILLEHDYKYRPEKKWAGNSFKDIFIKQSHLGEIVVELHTRLFWHHEAPIEGEREALTIPGFHLLSLENQLMHLCGHLSFQHTFIKLFWLFDIQFFLQKYSHKIDWLEFWDLCRKYNLLISSFVVLKTLDLPETKEVMWPGLNSWQALQVRSLRTLISHDFLLRPRRFPFRYLTIKWLLKDNMLLNFRYWLGWIRKL